MSFFIILFFFPLSFTTRCMMQCFSTEHSEKLRTLIVDFVEQESYSSDIIEISATLLASGANPNEKLHPKTNDTIFLKLLFYLPRKHNLNFFRDENDTKEKIRDLLLIKNTLLTVMIHAGADLCKPVTMINFWEREVEKMLHGQLLGVTTIFRRHVEIIKSLLYKDIVPIV